MFYRLNQPLIACAEYPANSDLPHRIVRKPVTVCALEQDAVVVTDGIHQQRFGLDGRCLKNKRTWIEEPA
jgi:hypothetical protein